MKKPQKHKRDLREPVIVLAAALLWNEVVYLGARELARARPHYDMTTFLDRLVPFLPWTVSIYFGCYLFWCINYCLCAVQEAPERDRFFCADALAKGVCFLFFLLLPTTNLRPGVTGAALWDALMRFLYRMDAADNLFPSIHCLVSWLCWIGVRKRKDIPTLYRHFSLAMAAAVCLSTLTTRQHVIADVAGGVLLAECSYFLAGKPRLRAVYSEGVSLIKRKLFR